ncbi:MAG: 50S ribosomal protein L22 [Nanoarchaeota archaeon]|nr:50S ribosomal protein L22 [Nanoarchaeota archaeon]MBU1030511.1 50S ribosomal protein L22 [Nanoarchaeota archaeon]MBU1850477.1 50S ribosomal protein L22 [Nanoarchaeota archaeon]
MSQYNYSFKEIDETMSRAVGRDLDLSTKKAIEICSYIRNRKIDRAKTILGEAITLKKPIPFKRFTTGAGHKPGMAGGKFPISAATEILKILKSAESNAKNKGLGKSLKIIHISAQKASSPWHHGRKKRIKMKRTHIEVVLQEEKEQKIKPKKVVEEKNKDEQKTKQTELKDSEIKSLPQKKQATKNKNENKEAKI